MREKEKAAIGADPDRGQKSELGSPSLGGIVADAAQAGNETSAEYRARLSREAARERVYRWLFDAAAAYLDDEERARVA